MAKDETQYQKEDISLTRIEQYLKDRTTYEIIQNLWDLLETLNLFGLESIGVQLEQRFFNKFKRKPL